MLHRIALPVLLFTLVAGCARPKETDPPPDLTTPPANALRTPSGIQSKVLRIGVGMSKPSLRSRVRVHYTGWTQDGKVFDTTLGGPPREFALTEVIPGWTEALQLMVSGEKRRFWIPGSLGYDNIPDPSMPKGLLVFNIELLEVR